MRQATPSNQPQSQPCDRVSLVHKHISDLNWMAFMRKFNLILNVHCARRAATLTPCNGFLPPRSAHTIHSSVQNVWRVWIPFHFRTSRNVYVSFRNAHFYLAFTRLPPPSPPLPFVSWLILNFVRPEIYQPNHRARLVRVSVSHTSLTQRDTWTYVSICARFCHSPGQPQHVPSKLNWKASNVAGRMELETVSTWHNYSSIPRYLGGHGPYTSTSTQHTSRRHSSTASCIRLKFPTSI